MDSQNPQGSHSGGASPHDPSAANPASPAGEAGAAGPWGQTWNVDGAAQSASWPQAGQSQPGQSQPGQSQPGQSQPGQSQPGQSQQAAWPSAQQPQQPAQPQQPTWSAQQSSWQPQEPQGWGGAQQSYQPQQPQQPQYQPQQQSYQPQQAYQAQPPYQQAQQAYQDSQQPYQQSQQAYQNPWAQSQPQDSGPDGSPPGPPKRKNPMILPLAVIGTLVLLLVLGTIGYVAVNGLPGAEESTPPPTPTTRTTPTPTVTPTPTPSPTSYEDDTYASTKALVENPIYPLQAKPLECPNLDTPIPEGKAFEPWAEESLTCLHDHYEPVLREAGFTLTTPSLTFYDDTVDTQCGSDVSGAFYCPADQGIYVQRGVYTNDQGRLNTIRMMLHEFSHHVQNEIGILSNAYGLEDSMVVSRRVELQASCWTAMQLRGAEWLDWTKEDEAWFELFSKVDSDEAHGNAESRAYWYNEGLQSSDYGACNTWVVPPERVA